MKYDAFISYRHSELDMYIAKKVHKSLETFKVPRAIKKKSGKKNIKRVFRDQEELPIGSDLGNNIKCALEESEYLIVICSPRTKDSYWVLTEIETFISMHGRDRVLAILIEGEPDESFPELLLTDDEGNPVEPLAADVRGKNKKEIDKKMKVEIMRLAAPLLGCTYDDLRQRHKERKLRKMILAIAAVAVFAIAFGLYSSYNAMMIKKNLREKQVNQSKYMASKSLELLEYGDRQSAALVAMEALPTETEDRPYVASAGLALSKALCCYDTGNVIGMDRILKHELPVVDFTFNQEGTKIATIDRSEGVYVWNLENGERMLYILPEIGEGGYTEDVKKAVLTLDEQLLVVRANTLTLFDLSGEIVWKKEMDLDGDINNCIADCETGIAICQSLDFCVIVDMKSGEVVDTIQCSIEDSFCSEMAFSDDKKKCILAHYTSDDTATSGMVTVYDFTTQKSIDYKTENSYILEAAVCNDQDLIVISTQNDAVLGLEKPYYDCLIERIDAETGETIWTQTMRAAVYGMDSGYCILKTRAYTDETEVFHNQVAVAVGQEVRTMNAETGETVSSVSMGSNVCSLLVSTVNGYGYVTDGAGVLHICDLTQGKIYNTNDIQTNKYVSQLEIKNGTVVIRESLSPDLTIMKYHEGYGMETVQSYDQNIRKMDMSEDEAIYSIELDSGEVYFYRTSDNSFMSSWMPESDSYYEAGHFIDDDTYMIVDGDGLVYLYQVKKEKEKVISCDEDMISRDYYITHNKQYLLWVGSHNYSIIDIRKEKVIVSKEIEQMIRAYALSEDGKTVALSFAEEGVCLINVATGESRKIETLPSQVNNMFLDGVHIAFSEDGTTVALSCVDNLLRVYSVDSLELLDEIPYCGGTRGYMKFLNEDRHILLQGDDYYIRVYDLETGEFVYVSKEQYNMIQTISLDQKQNHLILDVGAGLLVLQTNDYQPILDDVTAVLYMPQNQYVYSEYADVIYRFPYMETKLLMKEARNQFGSATLSTEERIQYNLE